MSNEHIYRFVKELSDEFDYNLPETAIILAAGHGKRIKSTTSKMLHKIWEVPTVERVYNACQSGLKNLNTIVVVGIKAESVAASIGKRKNTIFAYQEKQNGTGHAVQVALENLDASRYDGTVYIFPGDMGLIDGETLAKFGEDFRKSGADMMVLTGLFEGDSSDNAYGRIIRVKEKDADGNATEDAGKVIEIKEHKDILALDDSHGYTAEYRGRKYNFLKKELIENNEFNSGVYAFKSKELAHLINNIDSDNAQGEIYITDMIEIFNKNGLSVDAVSPGKQYVLMGFNDKAVLTEMNRIARRLVYNKIKKLVYIDDPDDFFIHENVVERLIKMDEEGKPLDVRFGKGVYIGKDVKPNYGVSILKNSTIDGKVQFGQNATVGENAEVTGETEIGENSFIGRNCHIADSIIGNNVEIHNSVLEYASITNENSEKIKIKNYFGKTEGSEFIG